MKRCGNKIIKGQTIAIIANPVTKEEFKLTSPVSGIIIGDNKLPLVYEGEALFHVASFETMTVVEEQLDNIQEAFNLNDEDTIF
jgi:predicted deacylase